MRPVRALGQHFLRDAEVLGEIAALVDVTRSAGVLEIGPGEGALTGFLEGRGRPVIAIDKDPRAIDALEKRFGGGVRAVLGDAVTADLGALLPAPGAGGTLPVVCGNLPYNAASPIYRRLLGLLGKVARLVLMVQREVAERIVASPGGRQWGLPSVHTALVARAHLVREVPPEAFEPRPKVCSAVLYVEPLPAPRVPWPLVEPTLALAQRLFQTRRKMLRQSGVDAELLSRAGIDSRLRAEQLTLEQLVALAALIESAR